MSVHLTAREYYLMASAVEFVAKYGKDAKLRAILAKLGQNGEKAMFAGIAPVPPLRKHLRRPRPKRQLSYGCGVTW
jgi:hypothetical protein